MTNHIGIIDYGVGNIFSIQRCLLDAGISNKVITNENELNDASLLIMPGVGNFDDVINKFRNYIYFDHINNLVLKEKKPILGICVGMQMMCDESLEGDNKGLGWIENSKVTPFKDSIFRTNIGPKKVDFENSELDGNYYFLHSFKCEVPDEYVIATSDYGGIFNCGFRKKNIIGIQFHPEKSHQNGLNLFKYFYEEFKAQ